MTMLFQPAWKPLLVAAVCLFLTNAGHAGHNSEAQELDGTSAPAVPSSGPDLSTTFKGLFDRFRGPGASDAKPDDKGTSTATADTTSATTGFNPMAFRLVDIENWSQTSNVELDPQCKTLVQPFGITDNAASLAVLAAKLKVKGFMDGLNNGNANANAKPLQVIEIMRYAAKSMNWLPMSLEVQLGESKLADIETLNEDKNPDVQRTYSEGRKVLADIVKDLPQPLPYEFRLKVRPGGSKNTPNATALPGGIILADRYLFGKGADLDNAYFVMAHEVSHVLQRHQTRMYQARLVDAVESIDGLMKLTDNKAQINPSTLIGYSTALKKLFINFTEQQELQADSCAMQMMAKRYPDHKQLAAKLALIEKRMDKPVQTEADGPKSAQLLDALKYLGDGVTERHPNTIQRQNNLKMLLTMNLVQK